MWFKNCLIYRLSQWDETPDSLQDKLSAFSLQPLSGLEMQTRGWVPPKPDSEPLVHMLGHHILLGFGSEKKLLPSSVVNQFAKQRALEMEERDGFKPGRKRMREIKDEITDELLPRAFAIRSQTRIWIDPTAGLLVVDAASPSKADDAVGLLIKTVPGMKLALLKTKIAPTVAMTAWLAEQDNPPQFTIDRDCELKSRGEEASAVRYVKHALESDEIAAHIKSGKDVTKLALTWADKLSFVLHENLQIKRLAPLDILKENADFAADDDLFNADFGLMTAELSRLIDALVEALGGELNRSEAI